MTSKKKLRTLSGIACASALLANIVITEPLQAKSKQVQSRSRGSRAAAPAVTSTTVDVALKAWLNRPEIKHSRVGVEVMDAASGQVLFESNGNKRHTPASTAKVITTACLYDLVGPDFIYKTRLLTNGNIKDDVLLGDLALETSEDPSFTRGDLESLVLALKNSGPDNERLGARVKRVSGHLYEIAPDDAKDNFHVHWLLEDFGQEWMPVSSSLVVDKNIAFAGGIPKSFRVEDADKSGFAPLDGVLTSDLAAAFLFYDPLTSSVKIYRGLAYGPSGKPDPKVHKDGPFVVGNPTQYNMSLLSASLADNGVSCDRNVLKAPKIPGLLAKQPHTVLGEHVSKPITGLMRLCLYESDNLYAQQFLRTIALAGKKPEVAPSLEERGLKRMSEWLSSIGVPNKEVVLFDGCGLSRKNGITPHALNLVLKHMHDKQPQYLDLLRSSSDKNGSGRFRFKTGAMDTVRGITGLVDTFSGKTLIVTVLVNGHTPAVKDVRIVLADLIERLKRAQLKAPAPTPAPSSTLAPGSAPAQTPGQAIQKTIKAKP